MKKKIKFVHMDSKLKLWLLEKLLIDGCDSVNSQSLIDSIKALISDEIETIVLGSSTDENQLAQYHDAIVIDTLEISPKSRKVTQDANEINLTPKEFDILYFLAQNRGEVFTKEQIYNHVWSEDYMLDDSNIMAFIRKIRKKIEPNPDAPKYILTIWGIGYKFNDQL